MIKNTRFVPVVLSWSVFWVWILLLPSCSEEEMLDESDESEESNGDGDADGDADGDGDGDADGDTDGDADGDTDGDADGDTDGDGDTDSEEDNDQEAFDSITAEHIQEQVDYLASDELMGRYAYSDEAAEVARDIADQFGDYGLEPLGDNGTYLQNLNDNGISPNVVGLIRGTSGNYVVIGAHYDHLEPASSGADVIFNGADDNASGTAAVLELAEAFGMRNRPPMHSVILVAFTAEELGKRGSDYFVKNPPVALEEMIGMINLDMISRGEENLIFCEGESDHPKLTDAVKAANDRVNMDVRFDQHPEWEGASDHASFNNVGVPALYFGVEDHPDYHQVTDHADKIIPQLAAKVAQLSYQWVAEL